MSLLPQQIDHYCEQFSALHDGHLDDAAFDQLQQTIIDNPEVRTLYVRWMRITAGLQWDLGDPAHPSLPEEVVNNEPGNDSPLPLPQPRTGLLGWTTFISQPTPLSMIAAALAVGILVMILAITTLPLNSSTPGNQDVVVAQISALTDAVWAADSHREGESLRIGQTLQISEGYAEVTYDNGVRLILEGPCEFTPTEANAGSLSVGRLTASVPPGARGFYVKSHGVTVTDLGTEFAVHTLSKRQHYVEVFQGTVEVTARLNAANDDEASDHPRMRKRTIVAGSAVEVTWNANHPTIVDAKQSRLGEFVRRMPLAGGPKRIPIADSSFEEMNVKDLQSVVPTTWQVTPANWIGVFDPQDLQFAGTTGDSANQNGVLPDGGQVGVVEKTKNFPGTTLFQPLSTEVVPEARYTLSFWVGTRDDDFPSAAAKLLPSYQVELLAGQVPLLVEQNPQLPPPGEFRLVTLNVLAPADASGKLMIRFSAYGEIDSQTFFDDVQLRMQRLESDADEDPPDITPETSPDG